MKYVIILPLVALAAIALVGKIKFDFVDAPYVGDPVTYLSGSGEEFEAHYKADDSVVVRFFPVEGDYLKAFPAKRVQSASGARYQSSDGRFVFWSKGDEASVFGEDDAQIVSGRKAGLTTAEPRETLYFDPQSRDWHDHIGPCHSCTEENGFGADGQISGRPPIVWQEAFLILKNDLEENPPVEEVHELIATEYSANPAWYGTHVALEGDIYRIIVATDHGDVDFLARDGTLSAWYTVGQKDVSP